MIQPLAVLGGDHHASASIENTSDLRQGVSRRMQPWHHTQGDDDGKDAAVEVELVSVAAAYGDVVTHVRLTHPRARQRKHRIRRIDRGDEEAASCELDGHE